MQHQMAHSSIIRIRQRINNAVDRISSFIVIVEARGVDEGGVVFGCEERVREFAEELFEEAAHAVYVVREGGGVAEVGGLACVFSL